MRWTLLRTAETLSLRRAPRRDITLTATTVGRSFLLLEATATRSGEDVDGGWEGVETSDLSFCTSISCMSSSCPRNTAVRAAPEQPPVARAIPRIPTRGLQSPTTGRSSPHVSSVASASHCVWPASRRVQIQTILDLISFAGATRMRVLKVTQISRGCSVY